MGHGKRKACKRRLTMWSESSIKAPTVLFASVSISSVLRSTSQFLGGTLDDSRYASPFLATEWFGSASAQVSSPRLFTAYMHVLIGVHGVMLRKCQACENLTRPRRSAAHIMTPCENTRF